ncbi:MAG: CBS domain-containing protein [Gammaproteobacteria bacterium]|nr:CBS domain-containing protein [Gammaproteobacteria bacterium]
MAFILIGPGINNPVPLTKLFPYREVEETAAIAPKRAINEEHHPQHKFEDDVLVAEHLMSGVARAAYQATEQLPVDKLMARQIMTSPVMTLTPATMVDEAMQLFSERNFRHLLVVDETGDLVGMVSDRDLLRYLAGIDRLQPPARGGATQVRTLMQSPVLTAGIETDVRYIARLFVERHIGAVPIVDGGQLVGMITRSDLLGSVMRHFVLELWA